MTKTVLSLDKSGERSMFGLWVYLMTDCILFAALFATYAVLRGSTFGGPGADELFSLPFVLVETLILLTSSFTIGIATLAAKHRRTRAALGFLVTTALLGVAFLSLELYEFTHLVHQGQSWHTNAFLSAFFTLVGTHGLHILAGLIWSVVLITRIIGSGINQESFRQMSMLGMFWHFLDVIWIFIFTFVYLLGAVK